MHTSKTVQMHNLCYSSYVVSIKPCRLLHNRPGGRTHVLRVDVSRERGVVTLLNLLTQRVKIHLVPIEGRLEGSHFIEEAT